MHLIKFARFTDNGHVTKIKLLVGMPMSMCSLAFPPLHKKEESGNPPIP